MEIKLETLRHQTDALNAIDKSFYGLDESNSSVDANYVYANPLVKYCYNDKANIDIKMETGTGKTYVYTRMMYELHQKYGMFKFVIVVPSPSIKEGTRSFISSDYAHRHFGELYGNTRVKLNVINAGDFNARSGRRNFPPQLTEFIEATRQDVNQIEVLLINSGMLHSKSMHRDDYDQTLLGGETSPIKAIANIRPVVIIDEPHRFSRGKKFYSDIEKMKPELIVRFGATFPVVTTGRGRGKTTKVDYYRGKPQFDLNAIDSFNQGLVKGIDIDYPDMSRELANNLYKVKDVKPKELTLSKGNRDFKIIVGENLADIDSTFAGDISYEGGPGYELSNGLGLSKDMKLIPGTFAQSYQDKIISEALDCHFDAEQKNFMRTGAGMNAPRIKTLSLFFIDSITSFRGQNGSEGWLAQHFENILANKLSTLISMYSAGASEREQEYHDFLKETLRSLKSNHQDVYAGYFSEDRGSSDEDIQAEVDDILKNKEKLLSFKDEQGRWITRRFLFSKWTLREGWDNPNVFVIAKLRSSGSEISKIQEVGRGLRLPVDETGHRLSQEEWASRLSFLVSYDEKNFADRLVGEINTDSPNDLNHDRLTNEMIQLVISLEKEKNSGLTADKLINDLGARGIIDFSHNFKTNVDFSGKSMSGFDAFIQLYPEVEHKTMVDMDRVRDMKKGQVSTQIKLRKSNWNRLKDLWIQLSQRKMVVYDSTVNDMAEELAKQVFENQNLFVLKQPQIIHQEIKIKGQATVNETNRGYNSDFVTMKYGDFLKQLAIRTGLQLPLLNELMIQTMKENLKNDRRYINDDTLENIIRDFNRQLNKILIAHYNYETLDFSGSTSIYNQETQKFVDSVPANTLGVYSAGAIEDTKFLYERPPLRYDSADPELKLLRRTYSDEVEVFGKLPKRAIKIPRYDYGTTTPDFIFKIKQHSGKSIYLVVETKAENMRLGDEEIRSIQEKYFDDLKESGVYYQLATSEEQVEQKLRKLENDES